MDELMMKILSRKLNL